MSRTVSNKIELEGRVITQPELRITPAGNPLLRFRVDCGERTGELVMPVVMAGGEARMLAEKLKAGSAIHLTGGLRHQGGGSMGGANAAIEIAAHKIDLLPEI
jgi:primosomal replication protein N